MDLYNLIISAKLSKGEGGDVSVDPLSVTENGTYTASSGHAYSPVTVNVPQPSGTKDINANGIYDVTNFASANVSVPGASGTTNITSNGMYDIASFASASVNVPGIVPSGTSSITANGIYDITSFASVDVNVSGGGGFTADEIAEKTISGVVSGSASAIRTAAFSGYQNITAAIFPNVGLLDLSAFYNCASLSMASFAKATILSSSAFCSCSGLTSLYMLASQVATLRNTNALKNTPMETTYYTGSFGSIYVPASLVDSYKTATNWSAYASRITAYEGE